MSIFSSFLCVTVRRKNLRGVVESGALLGHCGGKDVLIEMVRIHWGVTTAGWLMSVVSSTERTS